MMRIVFYTLLLLFPLVGFSADETMSFAPPPGDSSITFLGNIFGQVDGVLHGSGSQIMGQMFSVFNAAVLALGGMIITYTLLVSTMNTAQEGEMLGKKWSSIWVPVRATTGLALLMPKASGYCLLQIFVMWIVVQGVGAADKVWNAALDYLNRGGVVIHAQKDPSTNLISGNKLPDVGKGAAAILVGQVCMLGLQNLIEDAVKEIKKGSSCSASPATSPVTSIPDLCTAQVPNFINSVDIVTAYDNGNSITIGSESSKAYNGVLMPNLPAPFNILNGVCGAITWTKAAQGEFAGISTLSSDDKTLLEQTRGVAIQQMYLDLSDIARVMIGNIPKPVARNYRGYKLWGNPEVRDTLHPDSPNAEPWAIQPFGYPVKSNLTATPDSTGCTYSSNQCSYWAAADGAALFMGNEFENAISDYHGVMRPYLNLQSQQFDEAGASQERAFIQGAETKGWILAGSYFFDVVKLNGAAAGDNVGSDTNSGLGHSEMFSFPEENLALIIPQTFTQSECKTALASINQPPNYHGRVICKLIESGTTGRLFVKFRSLMSLIGTKDFNPSTYLTANAAAIAGKNASTVYGYIDNASMLKIPGQPGNKRMAFADLMNFNFQNQSTSLPPANFDCGGIHILFITICIGEIMGKILYNGLIIPMMHLVGMIVMPLIEQFIMMFLNIPIAGMSEIFKQGLDILDTPGINPIVALANMGTYYINFAGQLVFTFINFMISGVMVSMGLILIMVPIFALAAPLIAAWLGVMVAVGMVTAYYIPMLPYMIFTFGAIAWLMAVIEAMVAAPIVALGVTHPEGHEVFGKGEAAIMILVNVFLRPTMMVIGFIAGIALSYVGVWVLNAGFNHAVGFMQKSPEGSSYTGSKNPLYDVTGGYQQTSKWCYEHAAHTPGAQAICEQAHRTAMEAKHLALGEAASFTGKPMPPMTLPGGAGTVKGGYTGWAGVFAYFMSILLYTTIYMTIVEKAFSLIVNLPDKVLRWIGGHPESYGQETAQWSEQARGKVQDTGKQIADGQAQMQKQIASGAAKAGKAALKAKDAVEGMGSK